MSRVPVLVALSIFLTAPAALARELQSQPEAVKLTPAQAVKAAKAKTDEKIKAILISFEDAHPCYRILFSNGKIALVDATNGKLLNAKKQGTDLHAHDEDEDDDDDE